MPCRSAYLFVETNGADVAAARIDHVAGDARSRTLLTYLPEFLAGPDARPVVPAGLPLRRETYAFEGRLPRFLSDLAPQGANRERLSTVLGKHDLDDFSALVYARNGDRFGALSVGQSERASALPCADRVLCLVERTRGLATTGLSGTRPKSTMVLDGASFVARASLDRSGLPEDGLLDLYAEAGLPVAGRDASLSTPAGTPLILTRRFDRADGRRIEAVSAAALVPQVQGYLGVARLLRSLGGESSLPDLFLHAALTSVLSGDGQAPGGIALLRGTDGRWGMAPTSAVLATGRTLPLDAGVPLGDLSDLASEAHRFDLDVAQANELCERAESIRPTQTANLAA